MDTRAGATITTARADVATAIFGCWGTVGLYLDGWAHTHHKPESFFTPWHAILYSGVALGVAFFVIEGVRTGRGAPADKLQRLGFGIFLAGLIGDLIWHTVFGVEVSLGALLSPTHLVLLAGATLMATGPVRNAQVHVRRGGALVPAVIALTVATMFASFFTRYLSAFRYSILPSDQLSQAFALASVLITNSLLVPVVMYATERFELPLGSFAFLIGAVAAGVQSSYDFRAPLSIVAAFLAGLIVDLVARSGANSRVMRVAIVMPLAVWSLWLLAAQLRDGVHWPAEIPFGMVVLPTLEGWAFAALFANRRDPKERTSPASA